MYRLLAFSELCYGDNVKFGDLATHVLYYQEIILCTNVAHTYAAQAAPCIPFARASTHYRGAGVFLRRIP